MQESRQSQLFLTGEGAEEIAEEAVSMNMCTDKSCVCPPEMIKKMEQEREHYIHEHEEKAEGLMPFMWGIIVLSLIALYLEWKKKSMAMIASLIVLIIGFIAAFFAREVGTSGGEISHPEIRKGVIINASEQSHLQKEAQLEKPLCFQLVSQKASAVQIPMLDPMCVHVL